MNRKQHFRTHVQGESLEGKIQELSDKMYEYLFLPAIALAACIYIWMIFLGFLKVELFTAVFMSALLLVVSIRAFFKIKNLCKTIRNHQKGLDGERFVERFNPKGQRFCDRKRKFCRCQYLGRLSTVV